MAPMFELAVTGPGPDSDSDLANLWDALESSSATPKKIDDETPRKAWKKRMAAVTLVTLFACVALLVDVLLLDRSKPDTQVRELDLRLDQVDR